MFFTWNHLVMNPAITKKSPKPGKFVSGRTSHARAHTNKWTKNLKIIF